MVINRCTTLLLLFKKNSRTLRRKSFLASDLGLLFRIPTIGTCTTESNKTTGRSP